MLGDARLLGRLRLGERDAVFEVRVNALARLAELAPSLTISELRVLLHITAQVNCKGDASTPASIRSLAKACNICEQSVKSATAVLVSRKLIVKRAGNAAANRPAEYSIGFIDRAETQGEGLGQRLAQAGLSIGPGGLSVSPGVGLSVSPGVGVTFSTGSEENQPLASGGACVDSEIPVPSIDGFDVASSSIDRRAEQNPAAVASPANLADRFHKANPKNLDPELLAKCRRWLQSYRAKLGHPESGEAWPPHPPDDRIVAQFLSVGDGAGGWPALEAVLYNLLAERKEPGHSYAWFVTVAAQRIHGLSPGQLKQQRAGLRGKAPASASELRAGVEALAAKKKLVWSKG